MIPTTTPSGKLIRHSFGFAFQNHDCQIVNGGSAAHEFGEGFIDAVAQTGGGATAVLLNDFDQARFAEFFLLFIEALGHPVGIYDHDVARFDFDPALAVVAELRDADRKTADVE